VCLAIAQWHAERRWSAEDDDFGYNDFAELTVWEPRGVDIASGEYCYCLPPEPVRDAE
jgi:hypothetical protein